MTVTLELNPEIEARAQAQAQASGLDVKEYLEQYLSSLPTLTGADYGRLFSRPPTEEETRKRLALLQEFFAQRTEDEEDEPGYDLMRALEENPIQFREVVLPDDYGDE